MEFIPCIASTMAGLTEAQSPAIRTKVRGLLADGSPSDEDDRVYASIYKRLCLLVHLGLDVEPVLKTKNKNSAVSTAADGTDSGLALAMAEPESSQLSSQRTDSSSGLLPTPSDLSGDNKPRVESWNFGSAFTPAGDECLDTGEYTLAAPSATELAKGILLQDGLMVEEHGNPASLDAPEDEYRDEYEYVYEIVPVQGNSEDGQGGNEENWLTTNRYDHIGSPVGEPRDWEAWKPCSLRGYADIPNDEMQQSTGQYGVDLGYASGNLSNPYWADQQRGVSTDEGEGQPMYISPNCWSSQGTI